MALNTFVQDFPDWMQPRSPWTQQDVGQLLDRGVRKRQQDQAMVLQLREMALREKSTTIMNDARLRQIEEAEAEVADLPRLQEYARNPDAGIPDFQSPKSYQKLSAIDLSMKRSQAGEMWANSQKAFWQRFAQLEGDDQATLNDMLRESNGHITGDIYKYAGESFKKVKTDVIQEPVYGPDGRFLGMAITGKGTKLITNTGRMADVDKMEYSTAKKELAAIDKQLNDPIASRFFKPEQKAAIEKSRAALHQKIGSILSRYDNDDDTEQPAAPTAPDHSDPLGVLK